ncbi:hypothetical protein BLNAU_12542 [Blattamonas nauphoetae]|uniref:Saposin B-type domain-containing protein n=1 Tax=Blattamonas nauphoetae TaxID=2049346 RepID=A0ABQ9XQC4_9EUKA|nr:hypothetical protein BLNAU_12542 [Blattamonas nauphoetae]
MVFLIVSFLFTVLSAGDDSEFTIVENSDSQRDTFGRCDICKLLVKSARSSGSTDKDKVKAHLEENVCSKLGIVKKLCSDTATTLIANAWNRLLTDEDPQAVCRSIRLC